MIKVLIGVVVVLIPAALFQILKEKKVLFSDLSYSYEGNNSIIFENKNPDFKVRIEFDSEVERIGGSVLVNRRLYKEPKDQYEFTLKNIETMETIDLFVEFSDRLIVKLNDRDICSEEISKVVDDGFRLIRVSN